MIKRTLFLAILAIASASDVSSQTLSYKLLASDPDNYNRSALYIDPINLFYNSKGISTGSAAKLETVIQERVMPWVYLRYTWTDAATRNDPGNRPIAVNGLKNQIMSDIGGVLFFINTNAETSVRVPLGSFGRTSYSLIVPSHVKRMVGMRAGAYMQLRTMDIEEDEARVLYRYRSLDGLQEAKLNTPTASGMPAGDYSSPYPVSFTTSLYTGLHYRNVKNTKVDVEGYGKRSNEGVLDLYADIMYAVNTDISNVIDINKKEWEIKPQSGAIRKIGWRIGFSKRMAKGILQTSMSLGQRTGPILGDNFFMNGNFVSINLGVVITSKKHIGPRRKESIKDAIKF